MRWISLGPWLEITSATADKRIGRPLAVALDPPFVAELLFEALEFAFAFELVDAFVEVEPDVEGELMFVTPV